VVEKGVPVRTRSVIAGVWITVLTLFLLFLVSSRVYLYDALVPLDAGAEAADAPDAPEAPDAPDAKEARELERETKGLRRELRSLVPRSLYIVVDTGSNRLYVKRGDKVLHEAPCSTGSGGLLVDPDTGRQWIFDTPRGRFQVIRKAEDPVWTKPDWAFVEEGKPVPEKWSERRDYDTLGDYALYFGDGYMIHGTLYQRYLGQSITHGCVRLGDEDLARVYQMAPLGTPIYIF
jgi:L,D-transpeptidase YbiS